MLRYVPPGISVIVIIGPVDYAVRVKHKAENYLGWYGVLAILLAYLLLSFNVIAAKSFGYQLLNLTGALGIIAEALSKKDIQPAVLNVIWAAIALAAILRLAVK